MSIYAEKRIDKEPITNKWKSELTCNKIYHLAVAVAVGSALMYHW